MRRKDGRPQVRWPVVPRPVPLVSVRSTAPPFSETDALAAVRRVLQALGPCTYRDLHRALPRMSEAQLAQTLTSLALRAEIIEVGNGWGTPRSWHLAGEDHATPAI